MPRAVCQSCSRHFPSYDELELHITATHTPTPYCDTCIEWFSTPAELQDHLSTSEAHYVAPSFECLSCSLTFISEAELAKHNESLFHKYGTGRQFYCDDCVLWFPDQATLDRHLKDSEEHATHFACVECGREFDGRRELEAHLLMKAFCSGGVGVNDRYQRNERGVGLDIREESVGDPDDDAESIITPGSETNPTSTIFPGLRDGPFEDDDRFESWPTRIRFSGSFSQTATPPQPPTTPRTYRCLGSSCSRTFASPSALLQHLDSGACPSGINRHMVNAASISTDHGSVFTNRLLRASAGRNIQEIEDNDGDTVYGESFNQPRTNPLPFQLTQQPHHSQNSQAPYIPQCPLCDKKFKSPTGLMAHMNSPVHDAKIYHCPKTSLVANGSDGTHSTRNFVTLGALAQHLESTGCTNQMGMSAKFGVGNSWFNENVNEVQDKLRGMALRLEGSSGVRGSLEPGSAGDGWDVSGW